MQLTSLLVCLMTMAPVVIHAVPIPSNDLSLDAADIDPLFPSGDLNLIKRAVTKKPAAKPIAKPAAKPVAKPVAKPAAPIKAPAKAAAPVKAPAKAPVAAKPPTAKAPVDVCSGIERRNTRLDKRATDCKCFKKCNSCTANADCAFSTVTFTCVNKPGAAVPADSIVKATAAQRCPAVQQQGGVFPLISNAKGVANIPAGLPTPRIQALFTAIQPHIFTRESAQRPDSGQHLKSVWIANHKGPQAVPTCNAATGLCKFNDGSATGKTVWDDGVGFYSKQDVKNMCSIALALTDGARTTTEVRHVILTPLNVKICIEATKQSANFNAATGAGQGSCFPFGTAAASGQVHSAC